MELDYANAIEHSYTGTQTDTTFTASVDGVLFYSFQSPKLLQIAGKKIIQSSYGSYGNSGTLSENHIPISAGDVVVFSAWGDGAQGSLLTEVPYKS